MNSHSSREQILEKLRSSKQSRTSANFSVLQMDKGIFKPISSSLSECFKTELEAVSGVCILCNTKEEAINHLHDILFKNAINEVFCRETQWLDLLKKAGLAVCNDTNKFMLMEAGVTSCEFLIARTGSVMVSSGSESGRQMNVYPPVHIIFANSSQLVAYPADALQAIQEKYKGDIPSCISLVSGPSRTADIEKTLVLGAHGPKVLYVFIYEEEIPKTK